MQKRKFFRLKPQNFKIYAAGLLIYNKQKDSFLLQYNINKNRWDDFGGKVSFNDKTVLHTIIRETLEESNGLLANENNPIKFDKCKYYYIPESKYLLAILKSKHINISKNLNIYGNLEKCSKYKRIVKWIKMKKLSKQKFIKNIKIRFLYFFA